MPGETPAPTVIVKEKMNMKKLTALTLSLALMLALAACTGGAGATPSASTTPSPSVSAAPSDTPSPEPSAQPVELIVFAAASMKETMTEIAEKYKAVAPNVTITYTFDSSGTLKTQIEEGADCDLFISAAQKQMNQLDITADPSVNDTGLDFVLQGTRINLVENKVVLAVPEGNPAGVASFEDVNTDKVKMIALGNSDVPVGQYSQEIFTNMGVWDAIQSKITFGSNVKEVTTWVSEGTVDCGVVYGTDAYSAGLQVVNTAPANMLKSPVIYPAAVLNITKHEEAAKAFLDYLQTPDCAAIFEGVGFTIPG